MQNVSLFKGCNISVYSAVGCPVQGSCWLLRIQNKLSVFKIKLSLPNVNAKYQNFGVLMLKQKQHGWYRNLTIAIVQILLEVNYAIKAKI